MQRIENVKLGWEAPRLITNFIDETNAGPITIGNIDEAVHTGMSSTFGTHS